MKQFFIKKEITAIIFIISLVIFSIINCIYTLPSIQNSLQEDLTVESIDSVVNDSLYQKIFFIESYGYIQSLLNKKEVNNFEVIKDKNNMLYLTDSQTQVRDVSKIISRMKRLKETVESNQGKLMTLLPPDHFIESKSELMDGYPYNFNNETANNYIQGLEENNIDVLDFREYFMNSDLSIEDVFYKTDHHWKIESAFLANSELIQYLNKKGQLNLDPEGYYRDINHYNQITYKNKYVGSLGRKTGIIYSGLEDFTLIYPKYETLFTYDMEHYGNKTHREGRLEDTLINQAYYQEDRNDYLNPLYDFYSSYLDYNCSFAKIVNKNNPTGLKVAFYKDSFSMPLITFFSQVCSEIDIIDPRYYDGDINQLFEDNIYDYVFVSVSPDLINEESFIFYQSEE